MHYTIKQELANFHDTTALKSASPSLWVRECHMFITLQLSGKAVVPCRPCMSSNSVSVVHMPAHTRISAQGKWQ